MFRRLAVLSSVLIWTCVGAPAGAQSYGPDPRVTAGTLDNGLSYLLMPVEGEGRGSAVRLIVEAGLVHENEGQFGTADVAAEMARLRAGEGATARVEDERAVIGFDLADGGSLAARLSQLAGVAAGGTAGADQVAAARGAAADRLAGRSADERMHAQAMRRLNPSSRAVRRPAAGLPEAVRTMAPAAINEFLGRWYVASNMTVVVAAPGTADELRGLVQGAFGAMPRVPKPASPAAAATAWTIASAPIVIEDSDLDVVHVGVVSGRPGRPGTGVRDFRSALVQEAGVEVLGSLVETRISKRKVPFTGAEASRFFGSEGMVWTALHVTGDAGDWREVVSAAVAEVNRIRLHGIDRTEVQDALVAMASAADAEAVSELDCGAGVLADMLARTGGGPSAQQRLDLMMAIIGSISADDVEWEFNKRFDPASAAVVVALPARPGNPSESDVREVVRAAWSAQPDPSSELVRAWKIYQTLPVPGEIAELSQDPATGVWSGWLSNGIRFHFRQMAGTTPGGVDVCMTIAGGELIEDAATRGLSEVVAKSWEFAAAPGFTSEELFNLFQSTGTRMQSIALADFYRVAVSTNRTWLNPFMQRLHLLLTEATPNPQVIESFVRSRQGEAEAVGIDPNATFTNLMLATQFEPGEVRVRPPTPEMAQRITPESVTAWSRRVASQCPMEIAIVGDIEVEDALEVVRFYLGGLPPRPRIGTETFAALRTPNLNPLPHIATHDLKAVGTTMALTMHGFYICPPSDLEEAAALQVAANILNSRLTANAPTFGLPGGGFVATNFLTAYPGTSFFFYAVQAQNFNAEGVRHIHEVISREFASFAAEGPSEDELQPVREQLAGDAERNTDAPTGWWDHLSTATYRGRTLAQLTETPLRYRGLTREQVRDVFRRYYSMPDNRIEISVIPPPPDELLGFIDSPPPPQVIQEPAQPAGPPGGDQDRPGR